MKRFKHSLSHYRLLTAPMGKLVPLTWIDALPSDSIQHATNLLVRMSPMVAPMMHPVRIRIHHWFVPLRLIWEDFADFITGGADGTFEAAPPNFQSPTIAEGDLLDYLGFPTGNSVPHWVSALPVRAYQLIFNEFYRDEQLVTEVSIAKTSGADSTTPLTLQNVAWEKDMLTTARPYEALGNQITIPIGDEAQIRGLGKLNQTYVGGAAPIYESGADATRDIASYTDLTNAVIEEDPDNAGWPRIYADLSSATGITVNELREYLALQRYQEARNRFGSRLSEYIKYAFGANPQDARLQEPEYLGGGRSQVAISEVLQSQRTDTGESPLGTMAGHGISAMRTNRYRRFIPEHGIIMTLMSVIPKSIYTQAIPRKWHRLNKEMYYQKELAFIGEQELYNREVYADHSQPDGTFGFTNRYDEYRFEPSGVSGNFRH